MVLHRTESLAIVVRVYLTILFTFFAATFLVAYFFVDCGVVRKQLWVILSHLSSVWLGYVTVAGW